MLTEQMTSNDANVFVYIIKVFIL